MARVWTANRRATLPPASQMHLKSFTGSSAASIDALDGTRDAQKGPSVSSRAGAVVTKPVRSGTLPTHCTRQRSEVSMGSW